MWLGLDLSLPSISVRGLSATATILLSASDVSESATSGTAIGTLSVVNGTGTYTFTKTADPDSKFAINVDGVTLETAAALDYETATTHSVTIHADNGAGSTLDRTFIISVTNVLEVTLSALTLSANDIVGGSAEDTVVGAIQNKSSGSSLSLIDSSGNQFKISGTNLVAGPVPTDFEVETNPTVTIRETHADGSNSPRDTVLSIDVLDDSLALVLDNNSIAEDAANPDPVGTISLSGSFSGTAAITLSDDASGTFDLTDNGDGTADLFVLDNTLLATNPSLDITVAVSGTTPDPTDLAATIWVVAVAPFIDLVAASDSGSISTDNITSQNRPTFDFTATLYENDTVKFYDNAVLLDSHTVTADEVSTGKISLSITLSDGSHPLTATISRGGFESSASNTETVVVDTVAPSVNGAISITSTPAVGDTYDTGEDIDFTIAFTENVTVTGTPQLTINVGGVSEIAAYASGSGTSSLVFTYTVQLGDTDANGVSVAANSLALNSGTIKDAAGNNATLTHAALTDQSSHKVDGVTGGGAGNNMIWGTGNNMIWGTGNNLTWT